jgi:hypothetical protein
MEKRMKRRTFLTAATGILAYPLLPEIYARGIPEWVVNACCDRDAQRYALDKPFVQREFAFASDARIALRLDDAKAGDVAKGKLPNAAELFAEHDFTDCRAEWSGEPVEQQCCDATCLSCLGEGILGESHDCKHCYGIGSEWTKEYRDDSYLERDQEGGGMLYCYECPHCIDGRDGIRCKACGGRGTVDGPGCVQIDGRRIANRYFHIVSQLPDIRFAFTRKRAQNKGMSDVVRFRFAGGVGLLMPIMEK